MGIKKELGRRIKVLRTSRGYTQEKLSELIGISQRALSSIELGDNFITSETLDKIIDVFEITAEDLFATNVEKTSEELIRLINLNIAQIGNDSKKLEVIYNITNSLKRN